MDFFHKYSALTFGVSSEVVRQLGQMIVGHFQLEIVYYYCKEFFFSDREGSTSCGKPPILGCLFLGN